MDIDVNELNLKVKGQLKGHYAKLLITLVVLAVVTTFLNVTSSLMLGGSEAGAFFAFVISLVMTVVTCLVNFLFIKRVRNENFTQNDVVYGFSRMFIIVVISLLLSIVYTFVTIFLTALFKQYGVIVGLFIQLIYLMLQSITSFAIYDGCKGLGMIISGCCGLIKRHYKALFSVLLLFVIVNLVGNLAITAMINGLLGNVKDITNINGAMLYAAQHSFSTFIMLAGANLALIIATNALLVPAYTAFANVYQDNCERFFDVTPRLETITINIKHKK